MGHFCGAPCILCKIEISKDYNFTIYYIDLERILQLGTLGSETMKNWGHIVSCGHYSELWGIMKYLMGSQLGPFIKAKSHKPKVTNC